ncbi:hypothetical protein Maes01_01527 [Microbulbifer aestuariivivens]|uniref:Porin n=1 Tax=Microbulbifer aestuariivivens TaxID=1908308 RepID=A0ABP9WP48_9GAMM
MALLQVEVPAQGNYERKLERTYVSALTSQAVESVDQPENFSLGLSAPDDASTALPSEPMTLAYKQPRQSGNFYQAKGGNTATASDLARLNEAAWKTKMDWPGSFPFFGTKTRAQLSGFVKFDAIHDNNAITTPTAFVTAKIVVDDPTAAEGADGQTHFSVQASRINFETRTPVSDHVLTTHISIDNYADYASSVAKLRLRSAFGRVTNVLLGGDILFGQHFSTVTDLSALPNTLDFEGPSAFYGLRVPMLRWTRKLREDFTFDLAMETPNNHSFINAQSAAEWPDIITALSWQRKKRIELKGSLLYRDLRAAVDDIQQLDPSESGTASANGWGVSLSGRIHMPEPIEQDFWTFWVLKGQGIGSKLNDLPPDAIYDTDTNQLKALPANGFIASYQHWWNTKFYSVASYSVLDIDNTRFQADNAYGQGKYGSFNIVWTPIHNWLLGVEALRGSRENKDGQDAHVTRFQFSTRLTF